MAISPLLAHLTYRTSGRDPLAFFAAAATIPATGLLACYFPARRAAVLDARAAVLDSLDALRS